MGDGNKENLIPFDKRTEDEARELGRKGGIASGKARREKANMRKMMELALQEKIPDSDMTYAERITKSVLTLAANPKYGGAAIRAYETILKTIGQGEQSMMASEDISDETRKIIEDLINADTVERASD